MAISEQKELGFPLVNRQQSLKCKFMSRRVFTWKVLLNKQLRNLVNIAVECGVRLVLEPGHFLLHNSSVPLERNVEAATQSQHYRHRT